ncbi:DUF4297 family anti-phage-associated protein [Uliginosibacterium sediminicola]|uniref:DUF4297 family anti-phage-associated protein n=1 Tax=Uliginosibacterium sediminicola TaxID=2024550 RepID=A0ABU9YY04_9RHOO
MTDRSATATIKGYFYQFDQTIVRLLEGSEHASVTVEGIEDIDIDDGNDSAFVQCKYYEGTEYNHSVIKEAVIHMLRHFHAAGCPASQVIKYRLYGHYRSGQTKLTLPLTDNFLKVNFLTYTKDKEEHKVHEELGLSGPQLAAFRSLLDIDVNALSYDAQQTKLLKLLELAIPGCSDVDAKVFYYPSAINVIQRLAIQADEARRKITKKNFLREVNSKDVIFRSVGCNNRRALHRISRRQSCPMLSTLRTRCPDDMSANSVEWGSHAGDDFRCNALRLLHTWTPPFAKPIFSLMTTHGVDCSHTFGL